MIDQFLDRVKNSLGATSLPQETAEITKKQYLKALIHPDASIHRSVQLGKPVRVRADVRIGAKSKMGKYSYAGRNTQIGKKVSIGNYCAIARDVELGPANHPTHYLSIHPFQYNQVEFRGYPRYEEHDRIKVPGLKPRTRIGHDVWIGAKAIIRRGVTIGTGAIVAGGAVVIGDVPPYAIVGGVPAKVIRYRFDPDTIEQLLKSKWWKLEPKDMKHVAFNDIPKALEQIAGIWPVVKEKERLKALRKAAEEGQPPASR